MSANTRWYTMLQQLEADRASRDQNQDHSVLIVDALNCFLRAYSASPVTNSNGEHIGGVTGFLLSIGHAIKTINPSRVVVVFDGKDGSASRRELFPEYKAKRKVKIRLNRLIEADTYDNQLRQLIRLVSYLEQLPITMVTIDRAEADDVIAYLAKQYFKPKGSKVFVMSSDKDYYQLADDSIQIWNPIKKQFFTAKTIFEDYGIWPCNFALYRALIGDSSDEIPGIRGVGSTNLFRFFPFLTQENPISVDEFIEQVKLLAETGLVLYKRVVENEQLFRTFHQIIQLSDSFIPSANRLKIVDLVQQPIPPLNKKEFFVMLGQDGIAGALRNPESWLREVTSKLDRFSTKVEDAGE